MSLTSTHAVAMFVVVMAAVVGAISALALSERSALRRTDAAHFGALVDLATRTMSADLVGAAAGEAAAEGRIRHVLRELADVGGVRQVALQLPGEPDPWTEGAPEALDDATSEPLTFDGPQRQLDAQRLVVQRRFRAAGTEPVEATLALEAGYPTVRRRMRDFIGLAGRTVGLTALFLVFLLPAISRLVLRPVRRLACAARGGLVPDGVSPVQEVQWISDRLRDDAEIMGALKAERDASVGAARAEPEPPQVHPPGRGARRRRTGPADDASSPSPREGVRRVLLAEDDRSNQRLIQHVLAEAGFEVDLAADGAQAVAAAERGRYDAILMDCRMPGMDGLEATRRIRALEGASGRRTPILALTGSLLEGDLDRCRAAGMDDALGKPFQPAELHGLLDLWLGEAPRAGQVAATYARHRVLDESVLAPLLDDAEGHLLGLELAAEFLQCAPLLVAELGHALDAGDLERGADLAHRLVSASGEVGALRLARVFADVETLTRSGEGERARRLVGEGAATVDETGGALRAATRRSATPE